MSDQTHCVPHLSGSLSSPGSRDFQEVYIACTNCSVLNRFSDCLTAMTRPSEVTQRGGVTRRRLSHAQRHTVNRHTSLSQQTDITQSTDRHHTVNRQTSHSQQTDITLSLTPRTAATNIKPDNYTENSIIAWKGGGVGLWRLSTRVGGQLTAALTRVTGRGPRRWRPWRPSRETRHD